MTSMRMISTAIAAALAIAALTAAPATAKSSAGLTSFHGTVTSVSKTAKTFRVKRANGTSLTFRVTSATVFERISGGFSGLTKGRAVEVKAKKVDGRWSARKVERETAEDEDHDAGDDHGGGGHGSDD